jgi:hypothetical protein
MHRRVNSAARARPRRGGGELDPGRPPAVPRRAGRRVRDGRRPTWQEAFLRPSKAHGTLIQLAQSSVPEEVVAERLRPSNLDELLG